MWYFIICISFVYSYDPFREYLDPFLKERVSGTRGNKEVQEFIIQTLKDLNYHIYLDSFTDNTPIGRKKFTNIVATKNAASVDRIVLACHYESKYFETNETFIGVSDSAVPCAIMLNIATLINEAIVNKKSEKTLQLIFFDGEEAFVEWNKDDSLYGSRHLAELMSKTFLSDIGYPNMNMLEAINHMIILDLISDCDPHFYSLFRETDEKFYKLQTIEKELDNRKSLNNRTSLNSISSYFKDYLKDYFIEDDHVPFIQRNVKVVHLINIPFPKYWHTPEDNIDKYCPGAIQDLINILLIYLADELELNK